MPDISDLVDSPAAQNELPDISDLIDSSDPHAPKQGLASTSSRVLDDDAEDLTDTMGNPQSVRPIDFPAAMNRPLAEQIAGGAQRAATFRENSTYQPPANSPFGVSGDFMVRVPGDARRYPTQDEIIDSVLRAVGPEAAEANRRYKAETGRNLGALENLDMNVVRSSFNPQTNSYEFPVNGSNEFARLAAAYLKGGVQDAQDEARRLALESETERQALEADAATPRTSGDRLRGHLASFGLSMAEGVNKTEAAIQGATTDPNSPRYQQAIERERRGDRAISNARAALPTDEVQLTDEDRADIEGALKVDANVPAYQRVAGRGGAHFTAALAKELAGIVSLIPGASADEFATWLNRRGTVLETEAMREPLDAQGQELRRGWPEKTAQAVTNMGFDIAKLVILRKTTGASMSSIMATETMLATNGLPMEERVRESAKAYALGKVLDTRMPRAVAAIVNAAPPVIEGVARGDSGEDIAINAGVQALFGGLMGSGGEDNATRPRGLFEKGSAETFHRPGSEFESSGETFRVVEVQPNGDVFVVGPDGKRSQPITAEEFQRWTGREAKPALQGVPQPDASSALPVGWDSDAGVVRYAGRDVIKVVMPDGTMQPFYRSSGINSKQPGQWFPFDGVMPGVKWFNKARFTEGDAYETDHPLHRFGTPEYRAMADALAQENIPAGREIDFDTPKAVNDFLGVDGLPIQNGNGNGLKGAGKVIPRDGIEQKAQELGLPVEDVLRDARKQGYTIEGDDPAAMIDGDGNLIAPTPQPRSTVLQIALNVVNAFKSIKSSADVSALFRQGLSFALSEPVAWYRGMKAGLRSLNSEQYAQVVEAVGNHPMREIAEQSGLFLATRHGGEEAFPSALVENLPVIKQTQNSFNATLDVMRLDTFRKYAEVFLMEDMHPDTHPQVFQSLARRVNSMSGRGDFGKYNKVADALNLPLFSPRLIKSRLDMLNPVEYMKMDPAVRKIALAQSAKMVAALVSTMMLARLAGAEVETDTEKADFGKIKFGDTRFDVSGGHARILRVAVQLAKKIGSGDLRDAATFALTEGRKNLAPLPAYAVDAVTGENVQGEQFEWGKNTVELFTPLFIQDLRDGFAEEGLVGSLKALPSVVGVGVQTYGSKTGERYTREVLQGHQPPREKPVNVKANEKIAGDPKLRTIVDAFKELDDDPHNETDVDFGIQKARRRKGESEDDYLRRLEAQEPLMTESLYDLVTSPTYQNLTVTERKAAIRRRVREIRNADANMDLSDEQ